MALTKDANYSTDLASLTAEYEENTASLAQSRANDPSYTAPSVSSSSLSSSSSNASSASSSSDDSTSESSQTDSVGTYTVQSGDNAYRIATNNGLTLDEFLSLNGKTEASVTPGEVVRIQ